jgi:hypothetical protein
MVPHITYAIGDVVRYVGMRNDTVLAFRGEGIISASSIDTGDIAYAVSNVGAWFDHDDLILVRRATKETLAQVIREQCEEEEAGWEDA